MHYLFELTRQATIQYYLTYDGDLFSSQSLQELVSPLTSPSVYSKFLISASCEYDESQGNDSSVFCPGYSDVIATPYPGTKESKLQDMADVFCAHCAAEDQACSQLFCAPDRTIVSVAMAMMSSFCNSIQNTFPTCYSEFCTTSVRKREALPEEGRIGSGDFVCKSTSDWSAVPGMDQWCQSNCKTGNDPSTCPESYCQCSEPEDTSVPVNSLQNSCLKWGASLAWSIVKGMDSWCHASCSLGGDCPESHCQCIESSPDLTTTTTSTTDSIKTASTVSSISTSSVTITTQTTSSSSQTSPTTFTSARTPITSTSTTTATTKFTKSPSATTSTTSSSTTTSKTSSSTMSPVTTKSESSISSTLPSLTTSSASLTTLSVSKSSPTKTLLSSSISASTPSSSTFSTSATTSSASTSSTSTSTSTSSLSPSTTSPTTPTTITSTFSRSPSSTLTSTLLAKTSASTTSTSTSKFPSSTTTYTTTTSPITSKTTTSISSSSSPSSPTTSTFTQSGTSSASVKISTSTSTTSPITSTSTTLPTTSSTSASTTTSSSSTFSTSSTTSSTTSTSTQSLTTASASASSPATTSTVSTSTSTTQSSTSFSSAGTTEVTVSTSAITIANFTDADSQNVVSQIVCDHAESLDQNLLSDRYCTQQATPVYGGYSSDVLDQVLNFAPKILCALTNTAGRSDTCPNMFCGETPLSRQLIKSSLCSVCQQFSHTLTQSCATAYCS